MKFDKNEFKEEILEEGKKVKEMFNRHKISDMKDLTECGKKARY